MENSKHRPEHRRLAASVRPEHSNDFAGTASQKHAGENAVLAKGVRETVDFQRSYVHRLPARYASSNTIAETAPAMTQEPKTR